MADPCRIVSDLMVHLPGVDCVNKRPPNSVSSTRRHCVLELHLALTAAGGHNAEAVDGDGAGASEGEAGDDESRRGSFHRPTRFAALKHLDSHAPVSFTRKLQIPGHLPASVVPESSSKHGRNSSLCW